MSRLDITELEERDYGRYDQLVRDSPHGSVWSLASFALYCGHRFTVLGAFKGRELVGGGALPLAGENLARHTDYLPWSGIVGRSRSEGENQAIARHVAEYCLGRWPESTLSLPPEWTDIREFTWAGWRHHVRYTYRGWGDPYEKRVRVRPADIKVGMVGEAHWNEVHYHTHDSDIVCLFDNRHGYYWKANEGGSWHTELVNRFINDCRHLGLSFDLVGANSPNRSLFKRGFGGCLVPYFTVTTSDVLDLRRYANWATRSGSICPHKRDRISESASAAL